jgi:PAS domain S-box-containing protein
MAQPVKILLVEDNPHDAELVLREVRRGGYEPAWQRVDTEVDFLKRLNEGHDIILSDYQMPQFSGLRALELLRASGLDIPFILVSGTIGEDIAVAAIKEGAADYLLKDRLARLGHAIDHALEQGRLRRERRQADRLVQESEERLRNIFDGILTFVGLFSTDGRVLEINQAALRALGLRREDVLGRFLADGPWWAQSPATQRQVSEALRTAVSGQTVTQEIAAAYHGQTRVIDTVFHPLRDGLGRVAQVVGSGVDVTRRKESEKQIQEQLTELLRWQEVMLGREDRVQALKAEVNELLVQRHHPPRYTNPSAS